MSWPRELTEAGVGLGLDHHRVLNQRDMRDGLASSVGLESHFDRALAPAQPVDPASKRMTIPSLCDGLMANS
jgi:hypothetical protein